MTSDLTRNILDALGLPAEAMVNQRIPKKLIIEHGTSSSSDRRNVTDGIEEVRWLAVIKPTNSGISSFVDEVRDYSEISVLSALLKPTAKNTRLDEIIHRSIPYPILLITSINDNAMISLAHKRRSLNEKCAFVIDGKILSLTLGSDVPKDVMHSFFQSLSVAKVQERNLFSLFEMWRNSFISLMASQVTGEFTSSTTNDGARGRATAVADYEALGSEIKRKRAIAAKERQLSKQVELNLEIKDLEARLNSVKEKL